MNFKNNTSKKEVLKGGNMPHPNLDPHLSMIADSQLMYKDMKMGQWIVITAEDAKTGKPGKVVLRVLSIRKNKEGHHEATFEYFGDDFTFWLPEAQGKVKIELGAYLESGISAILIPHYIQRMVGFGGIGSIRDYSFDCVGGNYEKQIVVHNISRLETFHDENEKFLPPDLTAHLAKIEKTKKDHENFLENDLPEKIVLPSDKKLLEQLQRKLEEYKHRLDPYKHPVQLSDPYCKIAVLERLLERGEIIPSKIREEIKNEPWFTAERFYAACWVIDDYCQTGGHNIRGGTGLKFK